MALFIDNQEILKMTIDGQNIETLNLDGVKVAAKPIITTQPVGGTITDSQTKTLTVVADGLGSTLSYQWYNNGAAISGATATSYTFDPTSTGTFAFYCRVHGFSGYTDTSSVNVVVNSAAPTITTQPTGGTIYYHQTKTLTVVADGHGSTLKYQWYKDGAAISGATSSSYTFDPSSAGSFKFFCRVTTSASVDTTTVTVTVSGATMTFDVSTIHNVSTTIVYGATNPGNLTMNNNNIVASEIGSTYVNGNHDHSYISLSLPSGVTDGYLNLMTPNSQGKSRFYLSKDETGVSTNNSDVIFTKDDLNKSFGAYWEDS